MSVETDVDTGESKVLDDMPFAYAASGLPVPARRPTLPIITAGPRRLWHSIRNRASSRRRGSQARSQSPPPPPPPIPTGDKGEAYTEGGPDYRHPTVHPVNRSMWNPLNLYRYVTFAWLNPMMAIGNKRPLKRSDMIDLPPQNHSEVLVNKLEHAWERTRHGRNPIAMMYLLAFLRPILISMAMILFESGVQILQPICLGRMVRALGTGDVREMYLWAMGLAITSLWYSLNHHIVFLWAWRVGMDMRTATIALIYRKMLRVNSQQMAEISSGKLVNMISNDVERFNTASVFLPYIIVAPIQTAIVLWLVWDFLSFGALAGVGFLLAMTPLHFVMSKCFSKLRQKTSSRTDERIKVMNELFAGIRVVKMYAWEKPFAAMVNALRTRELSAIRSTLLLRGFNMTFYVVATPLTSFFAFMTYHLMGNTLTAENVFTSMTLFGVLRVSSTLFFPNAIQVISELKVAFQRFHNFLTLDDHTDAPAKIADGPASITITNVTCQWKADRVVCSDVTAAATAGEVLAIVGPVGSGKSTILMALLKELHPTTGSVDINGSVTYATQEAWILSDTVRNNIIFGTPYDPAWYREVVDHCELLTDFALFPAGDMTEVGERGVTLSGGQKARLALARAVYARSDIVLLDDPLSAVDSRVGHRLFHRCIRELLRPRVTVLVTHQLQFIRDADRVLVLGPKGNMLACDTYDRLVTQADPLVLQYLIPKGGHKEAMDMDALDGTPPQTVPASTEHLNTIVEQEGEESAEAAPASSAATQPVTKESDRKDESKENGNGAGPALTTIAPTAAAAATNGAAPDATVARGNGTHATGGAVQKPVAVPSGKLISAESKQEGLVSGGTYRAYIRALGGWIIVILFFLLSVFAQGASVMADWFLSYWTNLSTSEIRQDKYLLIYMALVISLIIAAAIRTIYFFFASTRASQGLHDESFSTVLHAHMRFFDTNPVGRIVNRFSKDLALIDDMMPWTMLDFLQLAFIVLGIVLLVSIVNPWLFIVILPLILYFFRLRGYYARNAREIKRLEGVARSPIYSHFMACLNGLPTIRAFRAQPRFVIEQQSYLDEHTTTYFMFVSSSRWVGFRLDFLTTLFVIATVFIAALARDSLTPSQVGLSLTYVLQLCAMFQWCVRQSTEVENLMTSVERVHEYSLLPVEEAPPSPNGRHHGQPTQAHTQTQTQTQGVDTSKEWPTEGAISLNDMTLTYDDKPVLRGINLDIKPREKIGIVGRTGAGKSSLIAALYRLYPRGGDVLIDGVGTASMQLEKLRSSISVIPQDPVIFSGWSVRRNLDPFALCDDQQLWAALRDVQLFSVVESLEGGLDAPMSGAGTLSVGQRQLLCLARAILRPTRILVLDEATANVDSHTDHLIQQTIQQKFAGVTVLTIAHRLHTVLHSDRIAVLDAGRVVEFDTPDALQSRPDGVFAAMVAAAKTHVAAAQAPGLVEEEESHV